MTAIAFDITELDASVVGPVFAADHPDAAAEIATHNVAVAHRPAVIVGAACPADVVRAVHWAGEHGLPVAVEGTGHGAFAPAVGAVLVTTRRLTGVDVDPVARTARVGAGVRWREVVDAAAEHGLAPLCGSSTHVGVAGYTLGGGLGILGREHGFAADHVVSVTLVTADGQLRVVTHESDPELFWAVRGGKGGFGVVVELEFGLVEVPRVYGASVYFDAAAAHDVLHAIAGWADTLPENASTSVAILRLPPFETIPAPLRGRTVVHLRFSSTAPEAEAAALLAPMLEHGEVIVQLGGDMPFTGVDGIHNDPTDPAPVWQRGMLLRELTADTVEAVLAAAGPEVETPLVCVELRQMGGALARPASPPNAVSGREGAWNVMVLGVLAPPIAAVVPAAGGAVLAALAPWGTGTTQLNWLGSAASQDDVRAAYAPETRDRLLAAKRAYDPAGMFRFGHSLA